MRRRRGTRFKPRAQFVERRGTEVTCELLRSCSSRSNEFADHGIAGARVDRIADTAATSKAPLYSYFGNKGAPFRRGICRPRDRERRRGAA